MTDKKKRIVKYTVLGATLFVAVLLANISKWYAITLGTTFNELVYTFILPNTNSNTDIVLNAFKYCCPPTVAVTLTYVVLAILDFKFYLNENIREKLFGTKEKIKFVEIFRKTVATLCTLTIITCSCFILAAFDVTGYLADKFTSTYIYENYYVEPDDVDITADGKSKNLIYIYLESMENTYASLDEGGIQDQNLIPNLTTLAKNNISFSNTEKLGGAIPLYGATWTVGALFATSTGVPLNFPPNADSLNFSESFAAGITTLGDVLAKKGYNQEFLCGSDAAFGARDTFFKQHGNYKIFDYFEAINKGYIAEDYFEWWGFEDKILYDIAKDELLNLASQNKPFNFTMLTVDTHFVEGYVCSDCPSLYEDNMGNIISCADKKVYEFVEWCKKQNFYKDTVIVIVGDHPRMDTLRVENAEFGNRTMYNCFINSDKNTNFTKNRQFTQVDMFPTVLSAMGFNIEGNRLGLGTDLFSQEKTLAEIMGFDVLNDEVAKSSSFYNKNFS